MTSASEDFFSLTPDKILDSVEKWGVRCTGRSLALNSMENRVYEVEIEIDEAAVKSPSDRFRVAKFYRPGRWTREQILDEHRFLLDLAANDIPVITPLTLPGTDETLSNFGEEIYVALYLKAGGRIPDEFDKEGLRRMGRLIARMHSVGASREASSRLRLTPKTYGEGNLKFLLESDHMPSDIRPYYKEMVERVLQTITPWFEGITTHRIHGDLHLSNIVWGSDGPRLLDFDDMVVGPPVQDLWLLLPSRGKEGQEYLDAMLEGYESMRHFDRSTLRLIEPLRTLRFIHYAAWIARRWEDPSFKRTFDNFGSIGYWKEKLSDLQEQLEFIHSGV